MQWMRGRTNHSAMTRASTPKEIRMPDIHDELFAPWTPEQVAALNEWQQAGIVHPFTSSMDADGNAAEKVVLIATTDGWVREEGGPVVQTWAWPWMADPKRLAEQRAVRNRMRGHIGLPPQPERSRADA